MGWIEKQELRARVAANYLSPVGKAAKMYSWTFGGPLLWKVGKLGYQGLTKAIDGLRWTKDTALEAGKGAAEMTLKPMGQLVLSRLTTVKRFLWDVPLSAVSAALRFPIAVAKSPFRMVAGVRDAIMSIPKNAGEVLKAVSDFRLMDTIKSTRDGILDVLLPPFTRPIQPMITPFGKVVTEAWDAETQTAGVVKKSATETIPTAYDRIQNAPSTASGILAQRNAIKDLKAAQEAALEKAKKDQLQQIIDARKAADGGYAPPRLDETGNVVVPGAK